MDKEKYIFECEKCDKYYSNLGALHSHIERHTSPWTMPGNKEELMKKTKILKVTDSKEISIENVDGVPSRNGLIDYFTGIIGLKS